MAELFYTILTNTGKAKWAAAIANGTTVNLEEMALGSGLDDAYYNPVESQLTLKTEVWRGQLSSLSVDIENPNWIVLEGIVLATVGGFNVREVGIFDTAGDMIAIGKFPETYKPSYADGSTKDLWVKVYLEVSNTSVVTLAIDPAVAVPTVQTVNNAVAVHNAVAASESTAGHVQMATQAETTAGVVTNKAVVPATLKAVTDTKQPLDATLTALAAIATVADKLIYATGVDAFATATLTAFARTLLDDVDAAAARATLGLGTAAILASDTDGALAANSDTRLATQKAVKTYVDGLIAANDAMVFKGLVDCSTNPNYPAADRGHTYRISVAGKIGGASGLNVEAGDMLICTTDGTAAGTQATVGGNWGIIQTNIDGALTTANIGSAVQAYDATLTALAALATAADKIIYATGADTFSTATLTAFARTLLDDADAATARTTLGVVTGTETAAGLLELATAAETITGTDAVRATHAAGVKAAIDAAITALVNGSPAALNQLNELATALGNDPNFATTITTALAGKQPIDATLTALAALATAADKIIYATGADTFSTATLTAFARTLLDDADAATARTTLGVIGIDYFNGANQSLTANGYQKLPGGLIIQWGILAQGGIGNYGSVAAVFPIAFPNALFVVSGTEFHPGFLSANTEVITNSSLSGFTVSSALLTSFRWIAIGN